MGIVVLGAVFVDVKGYPLSTYIPGGRNVGRVEQVPGGVSRNVVEDIANVELRPTFVSLVDDTGMGEDVVRQLRNHKVNTDYILRTSDGMGAWLAVFDNHGDVCASISKRPDLRPLAALLDEKGDEIFRDADSIALEIDMDKELVKRVFAYARKYGKAVYAVVSNMSIAVERRDFLQQTSLLRVQFAGGGHPVLRRLQRKDLGGDGGAPAAEGPQRPHPPDDRHHGRAGRRVRRDGRRERHLPRHPGGGAGHHRGRGRLFRRGHHRPHLRQDAGSVLRHRQPSGGLRHLHQQQRLPPVPAGGVRAGRHCDGMRAGT